MSDSENKPISEENLPEYLSLQPEDLESFDELEKISGDDVEAPKHFTPAALRGKRANFQSKLASAPNVKPEKYSASLQETAGAEALDNPDPENLSTANNLETAEIQKAWNWAATRIDNQTETVNTGLIEYSQTMGSVIDRRTQKAQAWFNQEPGEKKNRLRKVEPLLFGSAIAGMLVLMMVAVAVVIWPFFSGMPTPETNSAATQKTSAPKDGAAGNSGQESNAGKTVIGKMDPVKIEKIELFEPKAKAAVVLNAGWENDTTGPAPHRDAKALQMFFAAIPPQTEGNANGESTAGNAGNSGDETAANSGNTNSGANNATGANENGSSNSGANSANANDQAMKAPEVRPWKSAAYRVSTFENAKGLGFVFTLNRPTLIKRITLKTQDNGGNLEWREYADNTFETHGGSVIASSAFAPEMVLEPASPVTTDHIVIWASGLPRSLKGAQQIIIDDLQIEIAN